MTARGTPAGQLRVLVIEDDNLDRAAVKRTLMHDAPRLLVTYASTLTAGLEHLEARAYDVVLLDLDLPDTAASGASVVRRVVSLAGLAEVVVLSAALAEDTLRSCYEAGAADVLVRGESPAPPSLAMHVHGQALRSRALRRREAERETELAELRARVEALGPLSLRERVLALPDVQLAALGVAAIGVVSAGLSVGGELAGLLAELLGALAG